VLSTGAAELPMPDPDADRILRCAAEDPFWRLAI
jgi:hypothetical protein